jgi:hypothetical protein
MIDDHGAFTIPEQLLSMLVVAPLLIVARRRSSFIG